MFSPRDLTSHALNRRSLLELAGRATAGAFAGFADLRPFGMQQVQRFAELHRLTPPAHVRHIATTAYDAAGDRGGALYECFDLGSPTANEAFVSARPLAAARTANGRFFAIAAATLNPRQFGAGSGGGDDTEAVQAAFDESARTGTTCVVDQVHQVQLPIYLASNAMIKARGGKILNVRQDRNPQLLLALLPGNYSTQYFRNSNGVACHPVGEGQRQITPTVASAAKGFSPGDIVHVRSREYYLAGGPGEVPLVRTFNRIRADWDGTSPITLEHPILAPIASPLIEAVGRQAIPDILNRRPLYVCHGARITGGLDLESRHGQALERGGALACDFHFGRISGLSGLHTNSIDHSHIRVDRIAADWKLVDLGGGFHGTTVKVGQAVYRKTARSIDTNLIALNECMVGCEVTIGAVEVLGFDYKSQCVCFIGAVDRITAKIGPIDAPDSRGSLFLIGNMLRDPRKGEAQSLTSRASLTLSGTTGPGAERYVLFVDGGKRLSDVTLAGDFRGPVTVSAVTLAGKDNRVSGRFERGRVSRGRTTAAVVRAPSARP